MVPGPVQAAAVAAWDDDEHVAAQRAVYRRRLELLATSLRTAGVPTDLPAGGFYLWVRAPGDDAWAFVTRLAEVAGVVASPGEFYGDAAPNHVRLAVVQPDDRLQLVAERLAAAGDLLAR